MVWFIICLAFLGYVCVGYLVLLCWLFSRVLCLLLVKCCFDCVLGCFGLAWCCLDAMVLVFTYLDSGFRVCCLAVVLISGWYLSFSYCCVRVSFGNLVILFCGLWLCVGLGFV